jgi:hypothetical protein
MSVLLSTCPDDVNALPAGSPARTASRAGAALYHDSEAALRCCRHTGPTVTIGDRRRRPRARLVPATRPDHGEALDRLAERGGLQGRVVPAL